MAQIPETRKLAQAMRRHAARQVAVSGAKFQKALVRKTNPSPLVIELINHDVIIEHDHILLGAWPRWYDRQWGFKVGDTLLVTKLSDGDWYVFDVFSETDLDGGDDWPHTVTHSYTWPSPATAHIVATAPYLDQNGTQIGVIAIFDPASL